MYTLNNCCITIIFVMKLIQQYFPHFGIVFYVPAKEKMLYNYHSTALFKKYQVTELISCIVAIEKKVLALAGVAQWIEHGLLTKGSWI